MNPNRWYVHVMMRELESNFAELEMAMGGQICTENLERIEALIEERETLTNSLLPAHSDNPEVHLCIRHGKQIMRLYTTFYRGCLKFTDCA